MGMLETKPVVGGGRIQRFLEQQLQHARINFEYFQPLEAIGVKGIDQCRIGGAPRLAPETKKDVERSPIRVSLGVPATNVVDFGLP